MNRPGVWHRVGMAGTRTGLNMSEALSSIPSNCDQDLCKQLFTIAEISFLNAEYKSSEDKKNE